MNRGMLVAGLLLAGALGGCSRTQRPAAPARAGLAITSLGRDGYLLRSGARAVLLDGFPGGAGAARDSVLRRSLDERVAGRAPFADIAVALVGPAAPGRFDPALAGRFLESHPRTLLAALPEVRAEMEAAFPRFAGIRNQLVPVNSDTRGRTSRYLNGVRVDFFRLPAAGSGRHGDDVLLHVIHMDRHTILDAPDPALLPSQVAPLHLAREGIDLALLPCAFLLAPGARQVFADELRAKQVVVTHLPDPGADRAMARVRRRFPNAMRLAGPMQTLAP